MTSQRSSPAPIPTPRAVERRGESGPCPSTADGANDNEPGKRHQPLSISRASVAPQAPRTRAQPAVRPTRSAAESVRDPAHRQPPECRIEP